MNTFSKPIMLLVCLLAFTYTHANEALTLGQQLDNAIDSIKEFSHDKKEKTLSQVEMALHALDARINDLEKRRDQKWDSMDQATRTQANNSLQTLHENRAEVAQWLANMKQSTTHAWSKIKRGLSNAFSALEESWHHAEGDIPVNTI